MIKVSWAPGVLVVKLEHREQVIIREYDEAMSFALGLCEAVRKAWPGKDLK